jgi:branched-chain amino acid aminotransferase
MEVLILEAVLTHFTKNNEIHEISNFDFLYVPMDPSLYEVIRVIDKVPVFLEEHFERLRSSARIIGYEIKEGLKNIKDNIDRMVEINNISNYNIKIVVNNLKKDCYDIYYYFITTKYPEENLYNEGISTILYKAVRKNPNAKIINNNLRKDVNKLLQEKNCYEALLVNEQNELTEGSRSNLFFINNKDVYTPPGGDVLLGITRQKIISTCKKNNINIIEVPIKSDEISSFDGAFICGTSPKVLPICSIDDYNFSVKNDVLRNIMRLYNNEIQNYINTYKKTTSQG